MPNGSIIQSSAQTQLNIPSIPSNATLVHLFPGLQSHSLLSIGQLCNEGCEATFRNDNVRITRNNLVLLEGMRDSATGLWMLPVPITTAIHGQANFVNAPTKTAELVAFAHAALFSPSIAALRKAIDKHFLHDFPGLTSKSIREFPTHSIATAKGHLDQVRQNQRSTKTPQQPIQLMHIEDDDDADDDINPEPLSSGLTHICYAATYAITHTGQIYTDQTGKFPTTSSHGMKELFILLDYDSNSIHAIPMRDRTAPEIIKAYKVVFNTLSNVGLTPKLHRLDNE